MLEGRRLSDSQKKERNSPDVCFGPGQKIQGIYPGGSENHQLIFQKFIFIGASEPLGAPFLVWRACRQSVVINYAIMVPFTAGMVLYVCLRRKLGIRRFLHTISGPALVGFTTASGTLAMMKQFEVARDMMKK